MVQETANLDIGDVIGQSVAFDKSGKSLLVGCSDGEIKIVSVDKNEVISSVKAHEGGVHSVLVN